MQKERVRMIYALGSMLIVTSLVYGDERATDIDAVVLRAHGSVSRTDDSSVLNVDALVENAADLRTYQVRVYARGGVAGSLFVDRINVEKQRDDYVFPDGQILDAVDMRRDRVGALRFSGGVPVTDAAYLASFRLRASPDASGLFNVNIQVGEDTFLLDSARDMVPFQVGSDLQVFVRAGRILSVTGNAREGKAPNRRGAESGAAKDGASETGDLRDAPGSERGVKE